MTYVLFRQSGPVEVKTNIDDVGTVVDRFYPLCADAVETEIETPDGTVCVLPDSYTQRATFK